MALISLRQLLDHAAENGYGVPAFNVNNLEQRYARLWEAADEPAAPLSCKPPQARASMPALTSSSI